ncbi:uncharacterized protein LOC132203546 [Neocloeon triangulifer]|uniref:uncharacterized protein LOC132203546 n=1 Tax=Neocloeon triangulifer TaxID=2078957 RepID=UPI00286F4D40|nr:uncharacterized protein LOC132203546 [Neocloeon triangulifer]
MLRSRLRAIASLAVVFILSAPSVVFSEDQTATDDYEATTLTDQDITTLPPADFFYPSEEEEGASKDANGTEPTRPWYSLGIFPLRQRQQRCQCEGYTCGCCAGMALQRVNISQLGCMNFTYDPDEFSLSAKFLMNERTLMERSVSGKNPPPLCFPIPSVWSYIPRFDFCAKFSNVFTPGRNFHACLEWETKINKRPILQVEFDCVRMGADGFVFLKPEAGGGLGPSQVSPGIGGGDIDYTGGGGGAIGEDYDPLEPEAPEKKKKPAKKPAKKKPNQN